LPPFSDFRLLPPWEAGMVELLLAPGPPQLKHKAKLVVE